MGADWSSVTVNIRNTGTAELCLVLRWVFQCADLCFNGYRLIGVPVAVDKSLYFLILINSIYKMWWNTGFKNYAFLLYLPFAARKDWNEKENKKKKLLTKLSLIFKFLFNVNNICNVTKICDVVILIIVLCMEELTWFLYLFKGPVHFRIKSMIQSFKMPL